MKILDRLPIANEHRLIDVRGEPVKLRPYQIVIRVSILNVQEWDPRAPNFPALLDTGNNLNFSIQTNHLTRWAGIHPKSLTPLSVVREGERSPSLHSANIWIHRNESGTRDLRDAQPYLLPLPEGIAIYPTDGSNYPRLPLLGLRAILKNNLKLVIDGKRKHVSLRSPLW
jgi:hypothetical protein